MESNFYQFLIIAIIALVLTVTIIKNYMFGLYIMCVLIPLDAAMLISDNFTVTKYLGIITTVSFLIYEITSVTTASFMVNEAASGRHKFEMPNRWYIVFLFWAALSILWANDTSMAWSRILNIINYILFVFLIVNNQEKMQGLNKFLWCYLIGSFVLSSLGLWDFIQSGGQERASAFGATANTFGHSIGLAVLISIFLSGQANNRKKALLFITNLFFIAGILASGSRTALIATAIASLIYIFNSNIKTKSIIVGIIFAGAIFVGIYNGTAAQETNFFQERFITGLLTVADDSNRAVGRFEIWKVGLKIFEDNAIIGVGINNFSTEFTEYYVDSTDLTRDIGINRDAHNIFLNVFAELGIVGGLIFFVLMLTMIYRIKINMQITGREKAFCAVLIVFFLVVGLAGTVLYKKWVWFSFAMIELIIVNRQLVKTNNNEQ